MGDVELSLIEWVNSQKLPVSIKTLGELTNGVVLYELMKSVAPRQFSNIQMNLEDFTWSVKLRNLKQVFSRLEAFYTDELEMDCDRIVEDLNLAAIARNQDRTEINKLMELVVGAAISCEQKEMYVSRLSTLSEPSQASLMFFIQKVLDKFDYGKVDKEEKKEAQKLRHDNRKISLELQEVQDELALLEITHETVAKERDNLKNKEKQHEDEILRLKTPQKDVNKQILQELGTGYDMQISKMDSQIHKLNERLDQERTAHIDIVAKLKDELDVANESILTLQNASETLELYKKRIEDTQDLKKKNKDLREINEQLLEKIRRQEDDTANSASMKQALTYYKEQLNEEKEKVASQQVEIEIKDAKASDFSKSESQIKQKLEFAEGKNKELQKELEKLKFQMENNTYDDSLVSAFPADYDSKLQLLEEENAKLKAMTSGGLVEDLNDQINDLIRVKSQLESRLTLQADAASRETTQLQNENTILEEALEQAKHEVVVTKQEIQRKVDFASTEAVTELAKTRSVLHEREIALDEAKEANKTTSKKNQHQITELERQVSDLTAAVSDMSKSIKERDDELEALRHKNSNEKENTRLLINEDNSRLQNLLTQKDQEIQYHIKTKEEMEMARQRELKLMTTVLHEIGLDLCKMNRAPQGDRSFLATKNMQLRFL